MHFCHAALALRISVHYATLWRMREYRHNLRRPACACALAALALLCGACDPLSFLDDPNAAKLHRKPKPVRTWDCRAVLAADTVLCSADRRIVTVRLAHVLVPGAADETGMTALARRTMSSREQLDACGLRAKELITSMLSGQQVVLDPEPAAAQAVAIARVMLHGSIDTGQRLVQEGLAMLVAASNAPAAYRDDELRAIETERGIWQPVLSADQRFTVQAQVSLHRLGATSPAQTELTLPPLHARDLVEPPPLKFEDTQEESDSAVMYCRATITVAAAGPPKQHDLIVSLQPLVKGTDLSGPLDSFERMDAPASEQNVSLRGGESIRVDLSSEPQELQRITRANRHVYSGYLIDGFILRVYYDGAILYSSRGTFDPARTLAELR